MQKNNFLLWETVLLSWSPKYPWELVFVLFFFLRILVGCIGKGFIEAITHVCHQSPLVYTHDWVRPCATVLNHCLTQSTLNYKVQDSFLDKKRKVVSKTILVLATLIVENLLKKVLAPSRLPKHFVDTVFLSYF